MGCLLLLIIAVSYLFNKFTKWVELEEESETVKYVNYLNSNRYDRFWI